MYKKIRSVVETDFDAVNQFIVDQLHSDVPLVESIGHYITGAGGKRMRPVLVLLSARSCGSESASPIKLAAVIEFIHTATLLHDDVVDMSSMRRGRPTANEHWNNPSSVLVGDFIYSRAFQVLVELGNVDIMRIIADTTNKIAEGEVLQLLNKHNTASTEEDYLKVIRGKTAILFEAAAHCGAILAGASAEHCDALKKAGMHIGMAFQLIDDVLDYVGDSNAMGKNIGDDLSEGKPTLPLIHAMQHSSAADSELVKTSLEQGGLHQLDEIIRIVQSSGGLEYTRSLARQEIDSALQALACLPDTQYRTALEEMAELALNRSV
jgi:octaprenyl-diphosphate synthase